MRKKWWYWIIIKKNKITRSRVGRPSGINQERVEKAMHPRTNWSDDEKQNLKKDIRVLAQETHKRSIEKGKNSSCIEISKKTLDRCAKIIQIRLTWHVYLLRTWWCPATSCDIQNLLIM